jgi:ketosteroid isomerase-like protein
MEKLVTPDATWWVVGRTDYAPYGGLHQASNILQTTKEFFGPIDEFKFTVEGSIAEGNRIAIEARAYGRHGAAIYENTYLIRFQLRDGKIESIREFFDAYAITSYLQQLGVSSVEAFGTSNQPNERPTRDLAR